MSDNFHESCILSLSRIRGGKQKPIRIHFLPQNIFVTFSWLPPTQRSLSKTSYDSTWELFSPPCELLICQTRISSGKGEDNHGSSLTLLASEKSSIIHFSQLYYFNLSHMFHNFLLFNNLVP